MTADDAGKARCLRLLTFGYCLWILIAIHETDECLVNSLGLRNPLDRSDRCISAWLVSQSAAQSDRFATTEQ